MVNEEQLILNSKQRKEALERKKVLIQLSKDIGFESRMFPLEFKHNTKEKLRYYLWMRELELWLGDKYPEKCLHYTTVIDEQHLEYILTERLKILLPDDTCKK